MDETREHLRCQACLGYELESLVSEGIAVAEEYAVGQLAERGAEVPPADIPSEQAAERTGSLQRLSYVRPGEQGKRNLASG